MSKRWLITGAQGLLGRYCAAHILQTDPTAHIVGLGRGPRLPGYFSHLLTGPTGPMRAVLPASLHNTSDSRFSYVQGDVCETESLTRIVKAARPAVVLHFASGLRGERAEDLMQVNTAGVAAVLTACAELPEPPAFVLASSGGVYGDIPGEEHCACETTPCRPADVYAEAKLRGEETAQRMTEVSGVKLIILRIFNVIAAGQDERHIGGRLALQLTQSRKEGRGRIVVGRLDPIRDFVDAADVAAAAVGLAVHPTASGVFNCSGGKATSIGELCRTFLGAAELDLEIVSNKDAAPGVLRNCGDVQRLTALGLAPKTSLLESARSCLSYYEKLWL